MIIKLYYIQAELKTIMIFVLNTMNHIQCTYILDNCKWFLTFSIEVACHSKLSL